ncbi:MHC class II transactivator-like [Anolis sagrei]|uniref:MHC class II transactivator-like n=1 Tax=Anolis sagrei TaxID=38937 RepID=UPI003522B8C7
MISQEYYDGTLLQEGDKGEFARKVSMVGNWTALEEIFGPEIAETGDVSLPKKCRNGHEMEAGGAWLGTKSYLELLQSELDDWVLSQEVEAAEEIPAGPSADTLNDADVFYTVEGEEVCQCSNTGEAYDKIATLAEYLLKDQQEKPVEELFGSLAVEESFADGPKSEEEGKKRRSSSEEPKAKRQKAGPDACLSKDSVPTLLQPNFHVQFLVTTFGMDKGSPKAPGPSGNPNLEYCLLGPKDIQVILTFEPIVQQVAWPSKPGVTDVNSCPGEGGPSETDIQNSCPDPSLEQTPKRPDSVEAFCAELRHLFTQGDPSPAPFYTEVILSELPLEPKGGGSSDPGDLEEKPKKNPFSWNEIFQTSVVTGGKESSTRVITLLGKSGAGKTSLAQRLASEWSIGQWPEFEFLFRFDCRQLKFRSPQNLQELLLGHLAHAPEQLQEVYSYILENPKKLLLIFDGFEDLKDQEGPVGAALSPLFHKKALNGCTLLLLSRPKDKPHQHVPKPDKILEIMGFSSQQTETYLHWYFEAFPSCRGGEDFIRSSPYLFSHCSHPEMCRLICDSVSRTFDKEPPSTITKLIAKSLLKKPHLNHQSLANLAQMAWDLAQSGQSAFTSIRFDSKEVQEFALDRQIVVPLPEDLVSKTEGCKTFAFFSFAVQNFFLALHLVLAKEIKDKKLTKYLNLFPKSKKSLRSSWDFVPCFLSGLLFSSEMFGEDLEKMVFKKQKNFSKYIRNLRIWEFSPDQLLKLFHCVHETEDEYLLRHLALKLQPEISFSGLSLAPSDTCVLGSVLKRATKGVTLDFRGSSIHLEGLVELFGTENVSEVRASLGQTVPLWRHLWESGEERQLRSAMKKAATLPFKAQTMRDLQDLSALVQLQQEMTADGCKAQCIPAIADLQKIEFTLGPLYGLKGFRKLVPILEAFPSLRHLDLDSPKENEIGDEGILAFREVLPQLRSLETLNLSRNKITDRGAEAISAALPNLPALKTLSLYKNSIGDAGAEKFAEILPQMRSLKVLDIHCNKITGAGAQRLTDALKNCPWVQSLALWSPTIPHGILDHLQHLDPRIRLL